MSMKAIEQAMQPRQKDRPQSIGAFRKLLDDDIPEDIPCVYGPPPINENTFVRKDPAGTGNGSKKKKSWTMSILGALLGLLLAWGIKSLIVGSKDVDKTYPVASDYLDYTDDDWAMDSVAVDSVAVYDYCDSAVVAE